MSRPTRWVVRALVIVLAVCVLVSCATATGAQARPGFVARDGSTLTLDGRPTSLLGINVYNAASRGNCWVDMRPRLAGDLATVARESGGGATVIRVWFFQELATVDGRRDWTELDRVLATARQQGFRVIPVFTDQWGACEGPGGSGGPYKDVTWYGGGYREPDRGGGTVSYRDWVGEVVARYRNDPTVAMWSLVNEAEARSRRSGPCPSSAHAALLSFTRDMGEVVKTIDRDHLLGLGTIGNEQCGTIGPDYGRLHVPPQIDVCEYHDYDLPPLPGDRRSGLPAQLAACGALDKPLLVGESGVLPADVGGVDARAGVYREKLAAQIPAGVAGLLMWGWSPTGYSPDDEYGIGPGDPSLPVLGEFGPTRGAPARGTP